MRATPPPPGTTDTDEPGGGVFTRRASTPGGAPDAPETLDEAGRQVALPAASMPSHYVELHDEATTILRDWAPPTPSEDAARRRMLAVLEQDPTALWRHHSPVHFTTSLVVLDPGAGHVALTLHAKAKRWFQFGGHVEPDDSHLAGAALREGREESGLGELHLLPGLLAVDIHPLPGAFRWCREHLDLRFVAVTTDESLTMSDESDDVRWFDVARLPQDTDDSLHVAVERAVARVRGD